ncbi:MAG TPA: cardiolipin synthase [Xanthomonadaceae bacterium]|nr:cardiolipin synthase [Xanthomonadaceae bacterium]
MRIRRHSTWILAVVAVVTVIGTLLAMNFAKPEKQLERNVHIEGRVDGRQFMHEMGVLLGPPLVAGNAVVELNNGREIFPAMLEAIAGARRTIVLETYIYWSGEIGQAFADALSERARAGVRVHVLVDWVGSEKLDQTQLRKMKAVGVEIEQFHPLAWYTLSRMNNRTHRKVLVVDGRVGFTGGVGIADPWMGDGDDPGHWRDIHFRVEGPVVAQMQAVFNDNWMKATGEVLQGEAYFPQLQPAGEATAQMFSSSPTGGSESMHLMYLMAIAAARESIDLQAAYFVPDALTRHALEQALASGVRLRIILPGEQTDSELVSNASRRLWGDLLAAGGEIHTFEPAMFHNKMMIVDRYLVSVGSTNIDARSFALNDEANLNIYDRATAERLTAVFEQDLARSRPVTLAQWQRRPWHEKLAEHWSGLFESQL